MVHPVIVPLTGTNQTPEATGMVNNNIFEINKNRETDSPKNDQERHGYIKPIMISPGNVENPALQKAEIEWKAEKASSSCTSIPSVP